MLDENPAATASQEAVLHAPEVVRAMTALETRRASLGLDRDHALVARSAHRDERGGTSVRVQQRYRGLPVLGGGATLLLDGAGNERELADGLLRGISLDIIPRLSADDARAAVEATIRPGEYVDEPRITLAILPERTRVMRASGLPVTERGALRQNADEVERRVTGYRLVYRVETAERRPVRRELLTLVDAQTGAIVKSSDSASYATNTARTFFSGDQSITVRNPIPNLFELVDPTRGNSWVWDEGVASGDVMYDTNGVWGDGQPYNLGANSRQTAAADCYFGMNVTWDMFENVFGWIGMDGHGVEIEMGVHDGSVFNAAKFNDFDNNLYFGDSNLPGGQMCTLDVVGHEYGHAVMDKTADVGGGVGESGGLNESYSDVWGILSRIYKKKGGFQAQSSTIPSTTFSDADDFWALREDIGGGRSLFNPAVKYWTSALDDTEEHTAAGPMDRAFYFLSHGSRPDVTSRTWSHSLPWGMTGLGNTTAAKIWFRTLTVWLQEGDMYFDARARTINAVRDLFFPELFGDKEKAVRNAFAGIDVGSPAANAPTPPDQISEQEPNNDIDHAQAVSFTSTNAAVPGLRKIDVFGSGTDKDDFKITLPCGKRFGARLEVAGDYDLAVFQAGNSSPLDESTKGMNEDEVIGLDANAGCTGSTTFFVRVLFRAGLPGFYVLHMDRWD
jgi:Zn-dependent metalloprotease